MPTAMLYDLADRLYQLAPWESVGEDQIIRLIHPETGESGYLSIMGELGTHRSLAVYLGEEALHRYNLMQEDDPDDPEVPREDSLMLLLETRQIQLAFGHRAELRKDELAEIKQLGRKYRGECWPSFRSYHPGRAPGPLSESDIVWLTHSIAQFLEVLPLLAADPCAYFRLDPHSDESDILTRECVAGTWRTVWTPYDGRSFEYPTPAPDPALLGEITGIDRLVDVECHFKLLPNPVGPHRGDALFPYLAITADARSGMVLGFDLLSIENQSHAQLVASVPDVFLRQWQKAGIRPASIRVATITTYSMLEIAAADLNTPMRRGHQLPVLDRLMRTMPF
jgi:hypothetical protein